MEQKKVAAFRKENGHLRYLALLAHPFQNVSKTINGTPISHQSNMKSGSSYYRKQRITNMAI